MKAMWADDEFANLKVLLVNKDGTAQKSSVDGQT